jgi:hypothetical protein
MPSTDSFTSTAAVVTAGSGAAVKLLVNDVAGEGHVEYSFVNNYRVASFNGYVNITHGDITRIAISFPITLDQARDLATTLERVVA